jgi:hypothetical protein
MFDIKNDSGFTDANDREVRSLDVVEYRFGERRGILLEALQDGDAFVVFRDTKVVEAVKWIHLCKVPAIDES